MKLKNVFMILSLLTSLTSFAATSGGNEKGNGGTGIVVDNDRATLADYYFKSDKEDYEVFTIDEDVKTEIKTILQLADYFKLSLLEYECAYYDLDLCFNSYINEWKNWDIRAVDSLALDQKVKLDINKLSNAQINELKYMMTYGYTSKGVTWIGKKFFDRLSLRDKALALIHERIHLEQPEENHEFIMSYITGLSKLRAIDQKQEKYTKQTFEYLKKYFYIPVGGVKNFDVFGNFKYSKDGRALVFFECPSALSKVNPNFTVANDMKSLTYIDLRGIGFDERTKNLTLENSIPISNKFSQGSSAYGRTRTVVIDGENNKITFAGKIFDYNRSSITSQPEIRGDNNEVVIVPNTEKLVYPQTEEIPKFIIYGNSNKVSIPTNLETLKSTIEIVGNDNSVSESSRIYIKGDHNRIQLSKDISVYQNSNRLSEVTGLENYGSGMPGSFINGNFNSLVLVAEIHKLVGDENIVVKSKFSNILGNKNTLSDIISDNSESTVKGNQNVLASLKIESVIGSSNFIKNRSKLVNIEKEERSIEDGKLFWSKNDHEKEKVVISEVQAIIDQVFTK